MDQMFTMRRIFLFVILWVVIIGAHAQGNDQRLIKEVLLNFFSGIDQKDTVMMRRITTGDFVLYEDGLLWNLDSGNANIRRHLPFNVGYELSDVVIHVDEHSADARYLNHADFFFRDTTIVSLDWLESATFRKTDEGWKMNFLSLMQRQNFTPPRYDTVRWATEHYTRRVTGFRGEPAKKGGVIMLGNSLTEYGHWKTLLGDSVVQNQGIAADNTFGMLDRLDEVTRRQPKEVFIEAGINDIGQGVPRGRIVANILKLIGVLRLACPGVSIYITSVLPTNGNAAKEYPEIAGKNTVVAELDKALRRAVEERNVKYIDLATAVQDSNGDLDKKFAAKDGLHLNQAGYDRWIELIKKTRMAFQTNN